MASMAAPRLTFLYPFLFAPARTTIVKHASRTATRGVKSTSRRTQEAVTQRYGSANEPMPHLGKASDMKKDAGTKDAKEKPKTNGRARKAKASAEDKTKQVAPAESLDKGVSTEGVAEVKAEPKVEPKAESKAESKAKPETELKTELEAESTAELKAAPMAEPKIELPAEEKKDALAEEQRLDRLSELKADAEAKLGIVNEPLQSLKDLSPSMDLGAADKPPSYPPPPSPKLPQPKPLETVLNMPSSDDLGTAQAPVYYHENASTNPDEQKPPHISTPPYVHHFDTYGLVKRLEEGGWTGDQAVTIMKAVRQVLAENMDLARDGLVSKSNVENETYLFRAACSELRTEIQTKRKGMVETSRTERAQLQHEVDILGQKLTQDGGNLKDDLRGMFDDRKMKVRNESRHMESKLQELNYRITVALNSDSRSDVEGVRWIITKRAIAALATCVFMVLGSIKYASSMQQWQEEDRKRFAALGAQGAQGGGGDGGRKRSEENMGAGEIFVQQGDNPAYVSLG